MGTQRTGSTALFRTLNFHPHIACGPEWVLKTPYAKKIDTTERLLNGDFSGLPPGRQEMISERLTEDTQWLGFKILFRSSDQWYFHPALSPALWIDRLSDFIRWLSKRSDIHVIHICRNDHIDWLKSKYLASTTGRYGAKPYPEGSKVVIPVLEAVKRLRAKEWIDLRISSIADTNPYIRINYEDFLQSRWATIARLMDFLESDIGLISSIDYKKLKKQSKGSPSDYIVNYSELADAVASRFSERR